MMTIKTKRLILRPWQESDLEPIAAINRDPRVMEFFPRLMSRQDSDTMVQKMNEFMEKKGWGFWAAALIETGELIGFIGIEDVDFEAHFTPAVEIGWRIGYQYWGKGYAPEGAKAALAFGFENLHLKEIVSFTAEQNMRSIRVMEKIGMHHDPKDDFEHPRVPFGNPLKKHVLYRLSSEEWAQKRLEKHEL